jgi:diacylglycerol kinase (ATP)
MPTPAFQKPPKIGPLARIIRAGGFSVDGLRAAWQGEAAFRQEVALAAFMLPASFWLGNGWLERAFLASTVLLVLALELMNAAVEAVVDKASPEIHPLAKRAKDMASASVMVALLACGATWAMALWHRIN